MKYYIGLLGLPPSSQIEITVEQYSSIIDDFELLKIACAIEERYDLVVSNYVEYENARINIAIDSFIYSDHRIIKYLEYRRELFRLINNLLSSCRLYFDQNEKDIKKISEIISMELSKKRAQIYESCFSFRLIEYLRNSFQHRTMPIEIGSRRNFENHFGNKKAEDSVIVALDKEDLIINDKKHIEKILSDLQSIHESKIDLRDHISRYLENISTIHQYLRNAMKEDYSKAKKNLEETLEKYSIIKMPIERQIQKMLYIYEEDEKNEIIHIENISDSIIRNIEYLQNRNDGNKKFSSIIIHN